MRCLLLLLAAMLPVAAQTKPDQEAVQNLPRIFADAFSRHDGHRLATIMADDVDFVTVGALWLRGRSDFETYHVRLLSGRFANATLTPLQIEVRFLGPGLAIVHWSWTIRGDRNTDASKREPRYGMMTMVAGKRDGIWLVLAAQNDNSIPGPAPEAQGIKSPIPIPRPNSLPGK